MMEKDDLKRKLQSFRYEDEIKSEPVLVNKRVRTASPKKVLKKSPESKYEDLEPSLAADIKVVFIGFNPGLESSLQQHHYAHFTNLFWKLFNESQVLVSVLQAVTSNIEQLSREDDLLSELVEVDRKGQVITKAQSKHDYDLIKYKIGFTDLVLRCTKSASELTTTEKLQNVPRLLKELQTSKAEFIVFVGKGIWEFVVKYMSKSFSLGNVKLLKNDFKWGRQDPGGDSKYNVVLHALKKDFGLPPVYVFPNTSGLVASMKYHEKLNLWQDLSAQIALSSSRDVQSES